MKKILFKIIMGLLLTGTFTGLQAQDNKQSRQERFQKIKNAKIAFITERLNLSSEQAQKFWPLYNQYDDERNRLHHKSRIFKDDKEASLSDQELRERLNNRLAVQQSELDLEKAYMDKFLKVITVRQLAVLYRSEREFTRVLLEKLDSERKTHQKPKA